MLDCTNYGLLRLIAILRTIITVFKISIPLIIMVMGALDLLKIVTSGTPEAIKESVKKLSLRFVAGVTIFFLPTIVSTFMGLVNGYGDAKDTYTVCKNNSKNLDYYKALYEEKKAAKTREKREAIMAAEKVRQEKMKASVAAAAAKKQYESSSSSAGVVPGAKHELSEEEISFIASVALCEEGDSGVASSASHIINKYELAGASGSVKDYIINSKWWSCSRKTGSHPATDAAKATVKDVIVLGNRIFPPYVDEHDCYDCNSSNTCSGSGIRGDICSLTTGGTTLTSMSDIKNKSNYKQDQTKIRNVYDKDGSGAYTFYAFGCDSCDPFGYTAGAKSKYDSMNGS